MKNYDYLIMGFGKSGQSVLKFIIKTGKSAIVYDENMDKIKQSAVFSGFNTQNNLKFIKKLQKVHIDSIKTIIISPSISIFNKNINYAKSVGKEIIGELEFGYLINKKPKYVAITGTNGKTTTTMLINQMLQTKYKCGAYGNIGVPLTSAATEHLNYIALEVSSFQLESIKKFKPNIFAILNIDADHLDRHKTIENYIKMKYRIFENCTSSDIGIINADDNVFKSFPIKTLARLLYFSKSKEVEGVYLKDGLVIANLNNKKQQIVKISDFNLPFNITDDILAAILIAKLCKIPNNNIKNVLYNFKLAPYRAAEKIINGIKIINDSKSTNIHSTINAIENQTNVILLLGGEDKQLSFKPLFRAKNAGIKQVICFGKTAHKIYQDAKKCKLSAIIKQKNCKNAVLCALNMAKPGDTILFSPACSSFDEFTSYKERGKFFDEVVNKFFTNC